MPLTGLALLALQSNVLPPSDGQRESTPHRRNRDARAQLLAITRKKPTFALCHQEINCLVCC